MTFVYRLQQVYSFTSPYCGKFKFCSLELSGDHPTLEYFQSNLLKPWVQNLRIHRAVCVLILVLSVSQGFKPN